MKGPVTNRIRIALAQTISLVALTGCGGGQKKPRTMIRLIHTIYDGGAVDVWMEGNRTKLYENVAYKDVTNVVVRYHRRKIALGQ